ncbi:tetratricopeptide repeat protein [Candidatus Uabimicrobium sp. HlEnr_7]|uniref:tetratricopeptide repeat protein n=1 Tax=Candidatus Uabimicrobium helgolandensis TaxID=3095367 RepID=UPI003557DE9A
MARHIKQLKEFSQNKELVLLVGSSIKQPSSHTNFIQKFLSTLQNSWDILELYLSEVKDRNLTTEAFYRVFYEYFTDDVFLPLQSFKYTEADPFYETIAQIVASKKLLALGTIDIDNRLSLALKEEYTDIPFEQHADTNIPYISYLNGCIDNEDSLRQTLDNESHRLIGASPNLEKFYHFITKNDKAKAVLLMGLHPNDFCWKKTYGFAVQLAKKYPEKPIFWMYTEKNIALDHLEKLGNVHLIPYSPDILAEVFDLQHVNEAVADLDLSPLNKWLEAKNTDADLLEFSGALLNQVISRSHSLQTLDYAMSSYQSEMNSGGLARVHRLKGAIYFEQGHLEKSIHNHNEAISLWSRSNNEQQLARENVLLADTYWNAGATDRAVQHYGEALSIYNMLENISGISSVTDKLARICDIDEDYELAQRYYNESLEAKKIKNQYSEMVQTLLNLSASLIKNQDWEQATKNLQEALRIGNEYYCHSSLEEVHQHLGLISMSALDYERAYEHYKTSHGIYQIQKDVLSSVFVNCNLGHICAKLENYDNSVKYYEGALESYEKMGDWQHLAAIYNNLGYINTCRKECGLAEEYFSRSVEIFVALGDVMNLIRTHGNLARVYTMQGEFENAIECYLANVEMLTQLDEKVELASTLIAISIVQAQSDQKEASEKSINEAIQIYQNLGMEKELQEAEEILQNLSSS